MTHAQPASTETKAEPSTTSTPAPVDAVSADEIAALRAERAELASLKAAQAESAKAAKAAKAAAQADAERAGETAKALDIARARLAELEGVEPLAQRWRDHEAAETKRLDERATSMPEAFIALYKGAVDIEGKARVLAAYDAVSTKAPKVPGVPPVMGAPASTSVAPDFAASFGDPQKWAAAKQQDPKGAVAWLASKLRPGGSATSTLGRA